jgi:branched-chain amino acid transport system ATP-binding protein
MTPALEATTQRALNPVATPAVQPALWVDQLVAGYEPGLPIVRGASLTVNPGEIVALLGPNGAGKSTLVKAVAGLVPVSGGRVWLGEEHITPLAAHELIHRGLAFVPQTENVFARLTVAENLELAAALVKPRGVPPHPKTTVGYKLQSGSPSDHALGSPRMQQATSLSSKAERAQRLDPIYAMFPDLHRQRSLPAGRLSGGQRQMLAVARALVAQPQVLMLDEPSAGLSPKLVAQVFEMLQQVRATGLSLLLVEQNVKAALALADRAVVLVEGVPRWEAPAALMREGTRLADLFLGRA